MEVAQKVFTVFLGPHRKKYVALACQILTRRQGSRGRKKLAEDPAEEEGSLPKEEALVLSVVQFLSGIIHRCLVFFPACRASFFLGRLLSVPPYRKGATEAEL